VTNDWGDRLVSHLAFVRGKAAAYHGDQRWGDYPYIEHLDRVMGVLRDLGVTNKAMLTAAYLHDVVEDTSITVEELSATFGYRVAFLVDLLTEPKGGNRKTRHAAAYPRVRMDPDAIVIKLADRLVNIRGSGSARDDELRKMYRREHDEFVQALHRGDQASPNELILWTQIELALAEPKVEVKLTNDQVREYLEALRSHFNEPVMPVSRYCAAMRTWFTVTAEALSSTSDELRKEGMNESAMDYARMASDRMRTVIAIEKSNLLYRLIYAGEELRKDACPRCKGHWSGRYPPCQLCGNTGWLPNESEDERNDRMLLAQSLEVRDRYDDAATEDFLAAPDSEGSNG
jgi:guanosine-3',5'-bis(diphosphate) 3'-pyrophosphohydrolase